jgi:Protein of unknown function (DUF2459)
MLSPAVARACAVLRSFTDWPLLLACVAALFASACSANRPYVPDRSLAVLSEGPGVHTVLYVVRRDWHIDVGFRVQDMSEPLDSLAAQFPGVRYLIFGFGDRGYLKSRSKRLPNMVQALWPGPGLILMTALGAAPEQAFGDREVIALSLSAEQLRMAQALVWTSLTKRDGAVQGDGAGPYQGSMFLDAEPDYSAIRTCNTWAAQVLKAAGQPVHATGVVFAWQLWGQVRGLASRASQPQ